MRAELPGLDLTQPAFRARSHRMGTTRRFHPRRVVVAVFAFVLLAFMPFFVLIRTAVFFYSARHVHAWIAIAIGVVATILLVTAYAAPLSKRLTGRVQAKRVAIRLVLPLVVMYCAFVLVHLSAVNAKTDDVREHYRSLHPVLRLAVGTVLIADSDIVITDLNRVPDDYQSMGLTVQQRSLHYEQSDGYVHAMDLRTNGRSWWKNWTLEAYFRLMGFQTLRHVGTADHLHVSLQSVE